MNFPTRYIEYALYANRRELRVRKNNNNNDDDRHSATCVFRLRCFDVTFVSLTNIVFHTRAIFFRDFAVHFACICIGMYVSAFRSHTYIHDATRQPINKI